MDSADAQTQRHALESQLRELTTIETSAPVQSIFNGLKENIQRLDAVIDRTPTDLGQLIAHFEALGERRGTRKLLAIFDAAKTELTENLNALPR